MVNLFVVDRFALWEILHGYKKCASEFAFVLFLNFNFQTQQAGVSLSSFMQLPLLRDTWDKFPTWNYLNHARQIQHRRNQPIVVSFRQTYYEYHLLLSVDVIGVRNSIDKLEPQNRHARRISSICKWVSRSRNI